MLSQKDLGKGSYANKTGENEAGANGTGANDRSNRKPKKENGKRKVAYTSAHVAVVLPQHPGSQPLHRAAIACNVPPWAKTCFTFYNCAAAPCIMLRLQRAASRQNLKLTARVHLHHASAWYLPMRRAYTQTCIYV